MNLRARRVLKRAAKVGLRTVSPSHGLVTLIERAGIAVNIGSQGPSVCDRLLAQMNRASAFRPHPHAGQAGGSFGGARDPLKNTEDPKMGA